MSYSDNMLVVGSYTLGQLRAEARARGISDDPVDVLTRASVAAEELHKRIGYIDPKGYFHHNGEVKVSKVAKNSGPSKAERAVEIFKRLNGVRADVVAAFQAELGLSKVTSMPYFYKAKKAAEDNGFEVKAPVKQAKEAKAKPAKAVKEAKVVIDQAEEDFEIEELKKLAA